MSYLIPLFIGLIFGAWIATYSWNKYYRSDIWSARKEVMLKLLKVQEAEARENVERHELAISSMIDARISPNKGKVICPDCNTEAPPGNSCRCGHIVNYSGATTSTRRRR